jgi:hypothetical protein
MHYDVYNGDADGICSIVQLRLAQPRQSVFVTGAKRDVALLDRVHATQGDSVTVLDVSADTNRAAHERLVRDGAAVEYFDHHFAGDAPLPRGRGRRTSTRRRTCARECWSTGTCTDARRIWAVVRRVRRQPDRRRVRPRRAARGRTPARSRR